MPRSREKTAYKRLMEPDSVSVGGGEDVFWVVGDQVSSLPGWQEGAMMSAEHVFEQMVGVRKARLTASEKVEVEVPDTRRLVEGR